MSDLGDTARVSPEELAALRPDEAYDVLANLGSRLQDLDCYWDDLRFLFDVVGVRSIRCTAADIFPTEIQDGAFMAPGCSPRRRCVGWPGS